MRAGSSILRYRRALLEQWIEDAITLLDLMDGDADFEDDPAERGIADEGGLQEQCIGFETGRPAVAG